MLAKCCQGEARLGADVAECGSRRSGNYSKVISGASGGQLRSLCPAVRPAWGLSCDRLCFFRGTRRAPRGGSTKQGMHVEIGFDPKIRGGLGQISAGFDQSRTRFDELRARAGQIYVGDAAQESIPRSLLRLRRSSADSSPDEVQPTAKPGAYFWPMLTEFAPDVVEIGPTSAKLGPE